MAEYYYKWWRYSLDRVQVITLLSGIVQKEKNMAKHSFYIWFLFISAVMWLIYCPIDTEEIDIDQKRGHVSQFTRITTILSIFPFAYLLLSGGKIVSKIGKVIMDVTVALLTIGTHLVVCVWIWTSSSKLKNHDTLPYIYFGCWLLLYGALLSKRNVDILERNIRQNTESLNKFQV